MKGRNLSYEGTLRSATPPQVDLRWESEGKRTAGEGVERARDSLNFNLSLPPKIGHF